MTKPPVLIIEDDPVSAETIAEVAQGLGCHTQIEDTYDTGLAAATGGVFELIIVDRMLPGGDGIDAIAKLRGAGSNALVLVVSALGRAANKIEGLERGADDYLAKPFDADELRARVQALLRRARMQTSDNDLLVFGDLEIRLKARTVHYQLTHIKVTPKEFDLLTFFARNAGEAVTRMQLLSEVWNLHFDPGTNVVDVHISRLRRKLEADTGVTYIHTARGEGYVFSPVAPEAA
ncbi:response regulator transcription factor [Roseobacter sp.]|uniref:response regulator transcription factor n=1 Tax=Roseobacter sp. TaxID=1907202 RepID=UPI00329741A1